MRRFLKTVSIIASFLLLTSFSCSKKKTIGDPFILYEVHGTVYGSYMKENDNGVLEQVSVPLKGIKVTSDSSSEPAYTSSAGKFVVYGRSVPSEVVTIAFTDDDGENNHGLFLKSEKKVSLRHLRDGGDRNYEGYWIATDVEVTMLKKADSMESDPDLDKFQ
jgi:hypothetical protein